MDKLTLKEQKILWAVLNQAQHIGLSSVGNLISTTDNNPWSLEMVNNWIEQTKEEYDLINTLKAKLCGDLE